VKICLGEHCNLGLAYQPFELEWWATKSDDLLGETLEPIAQVLELDAKKLASEYLSARPIAQHLLASGHSKDLSWLWGETMRHFKTVLAPLAMRFLLLHKQS
jgi:hypothetical protein